MSTDTTAIVFSDDHVAGGWTEHTDVARRICKALWHSTESFDRIRAYESDVIHDYISILDAVTKLEPGQSFSFVYSVGFNGTHIAICYSGRKLTDYEAHAKSVLEYDSGLRTAKFLGTVRRSDWQTDDFGQRWGANKYGLTIERAFGVTAELHDIQL